MSQAVEKPKKSRRRLRVSCVECTRRRQKCDRQQPCGLCKRRGVEQMCRWELEPFARPTPSHPSGTIRIFPSEPPAQTSTRSANSSGGSDIIGLNSTIEKEVKEAAIALAQLSVARHGEYLGTGSLVCALHGLNDSFLVKIPIDKSSGAPFSAGNQYSSAVSSTFTSSLQSLISNFPDRLRCDVLLSAFFEHENWRFGLPQKFVFCVYKAMWENIESDQTSIERINFHWVAFLFAMLALSPYCSSEEESRIYFLQALTGRRLAEDVQSAAFFTPKDPRSRSQGAAHGCIAASLMAHYMCDRGQMTEAWKLVGSAIRSAQNSGLHLDPGWDKWKDMNEDEQSLRRLAWHMCAIQDMFLSLTLGRPVMVRSREYHVPLQKTMLATLAADGTSDTTIVFQACLSLLLKIVSEEKDRFLSIRPEPSDGGVSFDDKMSKWEASLPQYFACHTPDSTLDHAYPKIQQQRSLIACYYFTCRMLFHRCLSCSHPLFEVLDQEEVNQHNKWNFGKLTENAISLLHAEKLLLKSFGWQRQICYMVTYFIFEAAVTLSIAICRDSNNDSVEEWRRERDAAIDVLQSVLKQDNGELTKQAILVLRVVQGKKPASSDPVLATVPSGSSATDTFNPPIVNSPFTWPFLGVQSVNDDSVAPVDAFQSLYSSLADQTQTGFGKLSAFDLLFNLEQPL